MRISFKANCQFINNTLEVIAETNQGYINSEIPVRVEKFCIEPASINDKADAGDLLSAFKNMKGTTAALRNSADAAALLCLETDSCGIAYFGPWAYNNGNTVSLAKKSCAVGYYSFGHEIGHNMGATHDPDTDSNQYFRIDSSINNKNILIELWHCLVCQNR